MLTLVRCGEDEKFLLAYVIFKLKLIKGKCIIFVSDIDRCYRLKLFFEQFGIKSCVLNPELPVNSRIHVVEEFNKNVYDIIIATDEHEVLEYRDMVVIIRDRIQALIKEGATLAEVKAARPTADYDTRYGASSGSWTTDMFVEVVYRSLKL